VTWNRKVWIPLATLAGALVVAAIMVIARPHAAPEPHPPPVPLVRAVTLEEESIRLVVRAQGRVTPRAEIDLAPEVSGKVLEVSPSLVSGGFFAAGDVLLEIDPTDYELSVERAKAEVAQMEVRVAEERAEADVASREWRDLRGGSAPPPLVAREPQLAEARARLAAARASLDQARTDLARTVIRAPFEGRVRSETVDAGQLISRGTPLARIYAIDIAEIRVPLPDDDLAYLDFSLDAPGPSGAAGGSALTASGSGLADAIVRAEFGGSMHEWKGRVVRTEGQIDPETQVVHAVVEVADPYGRHAQPNAERDSTAPLAVGLFVDVEILGKTVAPAFAVPRAAFRGDNVVLVIDAENRLRFREVEIFRRERERVVVTGGLSNGERVCISPLEVAVESMPVRVAGDDATNTEGSGR
jgi:multidrug efflux system membrane fusion protein